MISPKKQQALLTLIDTSILLTYSQKLDLLDIFPTLTEEQINALGKFLASEERLKEEFPGLIKEGIDTVLGRIMTADMQKTVYVGTGRAVR